VKKWTNKIDEKNEKGKKCVDRGRKCSMKGALIRKDEERVDGKEERIYINDR
jgi:hypothetical protein